MMTDHIEFRRPDGTFVARLGGLPYHVVPEDPLWGWAVEAGADAPLEPGPAQRSDAELLAEWRQSVELTNIQFALVAVEEGLMAAAEAEAWVARGEIPPIGLMAIASMPEAARPSARIRFAGARVIARLDPFVSWLMAAAGRSEDEADAMWRRGAQL